MQEHARGRHQFFQENMASLEGEERVGGEKRMAVEN